MHSLGYAHRIVYLNSMHAQLGGLPAPQSRDRMYVVFWRKGDKAPELEKVTRPRAWCPDCGQMVDAVQSWKRPDRPWGRYRAQYVYRCPHFECRNRVVEPGWLPAAAAIDWSIQGERIGDRKKPLSPKTLARIKEGLRRFGARPMHLEAAGSTYDMASGTPGSYLRAWPTDQPLKTLSTTATKALLVPVEGRDGKRAQSASDPMHTQTTRLETGLLTPYYGASESAQPTDKPMGTLTTVDRFALVTLRGHNAPKPVSEPMDTVCAGGNHHCLMTVTDDDVNACRFRMLEPDEVKRGMAFPADYAMLGTRREQVKMAGNAVTPPAARDLISTVAEALS
jgi:DNA (cytosine-5)-methyltransferase 1